MSFDKRYLALRLQGPVQSWGFDSQYSRRNTGLMPTKSAVAGMCCAALGLARGSNKEKEFLTEFGKVRMTSIAIPRSAGEKALPVRRLQDYHTVLDTQTAKGDPKPCHITHRQYLTDADFGVLLEGEYSLLSKIVHALSDPKWGVWLGRKTCLPTAPVVAGLKLNEDNQSCLLKEERYDALRLVLGDKPLESFTRQSEVEDFADGRDSILDTPVSFASERRIFAPRRIITIQGRE